MLYYVIFFFAITVVAAVHGFGGAAGGAAPIAQVLCAVFLVATAIAFVVGRSRGSV